MSQTLIQKERNERKEIVVSLLEQIEKLKNVKELKEKIYLMSDVLLDLYHYYQKCRTCFYTYITNYNTVCVVTKYSLIEAGCYDESNIQKIIEKFFDDPSAETKLWKELRNIFDDFVKFVMGLLNKHEENYDP